MPPSLRRKTPHRGQSPPQARPRPFAFHRAPRRADPRKPLAISFFAKAPQPFVRAMQPSLLQTQKRFRRPALRWALLPHPEKAEPVPPAFLLWPPKARRSAHLPACFPAPGQEKNSPVARKNPRPSPALFSARARRSRSPLASPHTVRLRASPFHTRGALAFAQNPSS